MLTHETSYMSNEEIKGACLTKLGLGCSLAEVRACLDLLERHGLVESSKVGKLTVVRLTGKGEEAGNGLIEVSGMPKPGVECPY